MSASAPLPVNEAKLREFMMKAVGEMGAAMNAALIIVGDKLGLYKAMAGAGPMTSAERRRQPADSSPTMQPRLSSRSLPSRPWRWPTNRVPFFYRAFSRR
jgi:hypothetical protein